VTALADLYRDLHRNPELSFAETRTAGIGAAWLREAGFETTDGVGGTGVVGVLRNGPGPTALLRADMDALPVAEATGPPYASTARGTDPDGVDVPVMHAGRATDHPAFRCCSPATRAALSGGPTSRSA
jgi:metal-dependent amidase/aminoacylase/carboxypeptidase family protein